jgi:hypothetical protein
MRKVKTNYCIVTVILMMLLASCGGDASKERLSKAEELAGPGLDAVDLAIVIFSLNDRSVQPDLSPELKLRLARYNGNTTFDIKCDRHGRQPVSTNGIPGVKVVFFPGADFMCTYKGSLGYAVKISDGEIGIMNRVIYVKEGTKLSVDGDPYVFFEGKWKRSG